MFETAREEAIWVAAWVDTEGNMCLHPDRLVGHRYGHTWHAWINISNTHRGALLLLQQIIGGSLQHYDRRKDHWKDRYELRIAPNCCRLLLPRVRPFLMVKQRQADLLIEALHLLRQNQGWSSHEKYRAALDANQVRLMAIREAITLLNNR